MIELLTAGAGLAGGLQGAPTSGAAPNATTQNITNKAKGNVFKGDFNFGAESGSGGGGKGKGKSRDDDAGAGEAVDDASGFSLSPLMVMAAMVFILVLISIVALVGR